MTNEEAIYELETNVDYKTPAIKEACQTAIKALEQQSCEDCISREAVINAINQNCIFENEYNLTASRIKNLVQQMSPVTPKEKTGKWIGDKCSNCGNERAWYGNNPLFCPDCGVRMVIE